MGCSLQKRPIELEKNALSTKPNSEQMIFQCDMPDSNRQILVDIKVTEKTKGMVHTYNLMYPEDDVCSTIGQNRQDGNIILLSQNISKSLVLYQGSQRSSKKANSDYSTTDKKEDMVRSQNLRSLLKSNGPQVIKQQKNVTFQLRSHARSPMSDKQGRKQKITIEHLEKIF